MDNLNTLNSWVKLRPYGDTKILARTAYLDRPEKDTTVELYRLLARDNFR